MIGMTSSKETNLISINRRKLKSLVLNGMKSAEAVNLIYVSDNQNGITRERDGDEFVYKLNGKHIVDEEILVRIKSMVIPPAWENVWICTNPNGHLQAVGVDAFGRKQYRYHPLWNALRNETKFSQLDDFGKALPSIRKHINADLALSGLPQKKVLAAVVLLMQHTGIRIGSSMYEKLYGSFGLSTMKDKHVKINGSDVKFSFKGKKGVYHDISLKSRKLARIISQCKDIPGKELFQYYDENGIRHAIDSGMVNAYIKDISGMYFTSKHFRTWSGSVAAIKAFISLGYEDGISGTKRKINEALDVAAQQLGNTRNVCRRYYVHPVVIDYCSNNSIEQLLKKTLVNRENNGLTSEERVLMKMLAKANKTPFVFPTDS
jgi:DNA topoisomerase-1